nr:hypothetical protein Iba_chr07cCG8860 [Ipomoea batatas]
MPANDFEGVSECAMGGIDRNVVWQSAAGRWTKFFSTHNSVLLADTYAFVDFRTESRMRSLPYLPHSSIRTSTVKYCIRPHHVCSSVLLFFFAHGKTLFYGSNIDLVSVEAVNDSKAAKLNTPWNVNTLLVWSPSDKDEGLSSY